MSEPTRHHYLPAFYLARWAQDGELWRFLRPRGPSYPVHVKPVTPAGIGYVPNLYAYPRLADPRDRQTIEADFLQVVDSKGAAAIEKVERNEPATPNDKGALVQFILSLLHRTPGRISFLQDELKRRLAEDMDPEGLPEEFFRHAALDVFTDLVASDVMISQLVRFPVFIITIGEHRHSLMTSDRPVMISDGLHHDGSFVMLPVSPRRLLILARDKRVPEAFARQDTGKLITAVNDAVVSQAEALAIGTKRGEWKFVENRLQRSTKALAGAFGVDGVARWKAPL